MKTTKSVFIGALTAVMALTLTACGTSSGSKSAVTIRGCTPQNSLIATNTNEVCGGNVLDASEAKLVHYNSDTAAPELDIAESITTTDAVHWTVKLKKNYKFQDGTVVKAKNFVDAWNWGAYGPNGQQNAYFFEAIKGYADLQCTDDKCATKPAADTMSGLVVVDDNTFTIETTSPTSNLLVRLGYTAFAPQPDAFFADTSEGKAEFAKTPIGAGPYQITSHTDTEMVLTKFAGYSGAYKGSVGQVTFKIYDDTSAAYNDVVANNLDVTDSIPTDQLVGDVWKKDLVNDDGSPRWGTKNTGIIQVLSFAPATVDPGMKDVRIRQAISMALDREKITSTIFNNARIPADGWVSPVVDGYKAGQCTNCVYDAAKAKQLYDAAGGYPGTLSLWINGDGGHDAWANAACNSIKNALGLDCVVQTTPNFATLRDKINKRELKGMYRGGWQMDYPSIENFLAPIYGLKAGSNDTDYASPEFNDLLHQAAAATDPAQANALYQQAADLLNKDMPTMPLWFQQSQFGFSTKIKSIKMTPFSTFDLGSIVLK